MVRGEGDISFEKFLELAREMTNGYNGWMAKAGERSTIFVACYFNLVEVTRELLKIFRADILTLARDFKSKEVADSLT